MDELKVDTLLRCQMLINLFELESNKFFTKTLLLLVWATLMFMVKFMSTHQSEIVECQKIANLALFFFCLQFILENVSQFQKVFIFSNPKIFKPQCAPFYPTKGALILHYTPHCQNRSLLVTCIIYNYAKAQGAVLVAGSNTFTLIIGIIHGTFLFNKEFLLTHGVFLFYCFVNKQLKLVEKYILIKIFDCKCLLATFQ